MVKIPRKLFYLIILILATLTISNTILIYQNMERNRVVKVIDGDSFETKDKRRIRLLSIDAPDKDRCLYSEAREELVKLILGKKVRLTDVVTDDYGRILANVWVRNKSYLEKKAGPAAKVSQTSLQNRPAQRGSSASEASFGTPPSRHPLFNFLLIFNQPLYGIFVNKVLVEKGFARFSYVSSPYYEELKEVSQKAKEEGIGIYSTTCRNQDPQTECEIKGNIRDGKKLYHLPHCRQYSQVIIDEAFGD